MKPYRWRTRSTSNVYVDSLTGDDQWGDGTMGNPYKTLGKAYRGRSTAPGTIVCRGRFCEDMADGNHYTMIRGDYMGAAVFDGEDTFLIYGFGHTDMIIENCAPATYDLVVHTGSGSLAGVGRALSANHVGLDGTACGVAGSSVIVGKSPLYNGCIGGNADVSYVAIWSPKMSGTTKLWYGGAKNVSHVTVYDVPIEKRGRAASDARRKFTASVFAKCDFFADEPLTFEECIFGADCQWFTADGNQLDQGGTSGQDRLDLLLGEMGSYGIAEENRPKFINCEFSSQTSAELFNNAEAGDLTLKPTSDAVRAGRRYYGALAPALNLPILEDSTGVAGSWDEQSANGILLVSGGAICLDETSTDTAGEIVSKVVKIDTAKMSITAVLTKYGSKWGTHGVHLSTGSVLGDEYTAGTVLPIGRYVAQGDIVYKNTNYPAGSVIGVTEENTTFMLDTTEGTGSVLREIEDPNIIDVVYLRSTPAIFAMVKSSDGLQRGGVYYNFGSKPIQYRGRTIAAGESFVAANNTDKFTAPTGLPSYQIGVMFDDTRVPTQEWVPAQFFGEYFVYKVNGVIQLDADGQPISSGNPMSYQPTAQGGYSEVLRKSVLSERYCQFKIIASKQ